MLIAFDVLPRIAADWSGEVVSMGFNPEIIDRAEPGELLGCDGPVVVLRLQGDEACFVKGTVEDVIRATQGLPPCQEQENTDAK